MSTQAMDKIKWLNIGLASGNAIVLLLTVYKMPSISHLSRCSFVRSWLRTKGFWANALQVGALIISFFLLIPQWNYICNQFLFTFDQAHGFMLFFATGATWAALAADFTLGRLHLAGQHYAIWVPITLYVVIVAVLLVTV